QRLERQTQEGRKAIFVSTPSSQASFLQRFVPRQLQVMSNGNKGAALVLAATVLFSVMVLIIKLLGDRFSVPQIIFVRQLLMAAIMLPVIADHFVDTFRSNAPKLQALRVALALASITIGFTAVIELPLAESTTIGFARSFFITLFAIWFLSEKVGIRRWTAVFVGFVGVVIVMRPGTDAFSIYSLYAFCAAATIGGVGILNRKLAQLDGAQRTVTFLIVGVAIALGPFAIANWVWPTFYEWLLFIALAGVTWSAQMLNVTGFKYGEASFLAGLDYIRLIFAVAFGWLFFGDVPDTTFYIGATIIIGAAIYTIYREAKRQQQLVSTPYNRAGNPN
ncbi:MAG: DMT family transporter, partial [Pseudomonadota bacterium]